MGDDGAGAGKHRYTIPFPSVLIVFFTALYFALCISSAPPCSSNHSSTTIFPDSCTRDPSDNTSVDTRCGKEVGCSYDNPEASSGRETANKTTLTILGLFELTTKNGERLEGRSELTAAQLAVEYINQQNILPGYTLEMLTNDTKCDPGMGVDAFFHALYTRNNTRILMVLGSACSEVTEALANVMPYWNLVQVSFGSTSPALSDRTEFPFFYRTVAPDSSHNPARLAFVKRFGWDTVTALSQDEDVYTMAVNDLVTELEQANITCPATITFAETDFKDQLHMLKELDTRIIIGSFSYEVSPKIFCQAYQLGMFGSDYAWILAGNPTDTWWANTTECPQNHIQAAVEGLILVSSHNSLVDTVPSCSGLTNVGFSEQMSQRSVTVTQYAPQTYDAVWSIALALRRSQKSWDCSNSSSKLDQFDYSRRDMAKEFLKQLGQLHFLGISGPVYFSGADRVGISAFYQIQGGEVFKVALFHPITKHLDFECPECHPLVWQDGQVPIARRVFKLRVVTVNPAAFLTITCIASIGITLALAFLTFNLHFRKLKYIKLSSPRLNNMAVVGCILVYTAVILLGLDHATLPESSHFPVVCTARVYLLSAGFSLAFGSMFTKTYRVHRIFTRSRSGVFKNKLLQDTQLISLICVLLLIDGLILTLWVIVDPIQRHMKNLTIEISASDRGVVYQPQVEVCKSQYINGWLGALYVYKGLLLIMGVYMAWETRHVKIPALNDSQYIGMSVYSVVITSGIVVVLANLISERATLAFLTVTILILISTTTTLCLLFVPKLHAILNHTENGDPIIHSMGLKIEYNTRRFVTDDRREIYYRVQVQNRVYCRELAALDHEINRLRKQLLQSPTGSSMSTSSSRTTSRKADLSFDERRLTAVDTDPSAGIGEALPMLLLSVLPPVIPRASWPSAGPPSAPIRRQVTFSSEPKLDDPASQVKQEEATKIGVFNRLRNLLGGSRSLRRKSSSGSMTGGIASALKAHMGYLAELVPGGNPGHSRSSSCDASMVRETTLGSAPIISITSGECDDRRKFSLVTCISHKDEDDARQHSQPVLSFRERARGSPRFPHKILPTSSLDAIDDRRRNSSSGHLARRQLLQVSLNPRDIQAKCHSLEDATSWKPTFYGPNSDVWRTAEFGIPLSELAFSNRAPENRRNS